MAKASLQIKSLARAHTERAIQVLAGIMDATQAKDSDRIAAAIAAGANPHNSLAVTKIIR
jgi:hypothetical protein